VQPQCGWDETTVAEEESLARAMVEATGNNLALLPLRELQSGEERPAGDPSRLARCVDVMRSRYDIVLVDLGPLEDAPRAEGVAAWASGIIDAVVLAHDPRLTSEEDLIKVEGQLAAAGVGVLGIVENFTADE
jgi:Mrp family chromosome partitioning ATPase